MEIEKFDSKKLNELSIADLCQLIYCGMEVIPLNNKLDINKVLLSELKSALKDKIENLQYVDPAIKEKESKIAKLQDVYKYCAINYRYKGETERVSYFIITELKKAGAKDVVATPLAPLEIGFRFEMTFDILNKSYYCVLHFGDVKSTDIASEMVEI